ATQGRDGISTSPVVCRLGQATRRRRSHERGEGGTGQNPEADARSTVASDIYQQYHQRPGGDDQLKECFLMEFSAVGILQRCSKEFPTRPQGVTAPRRTVSVRRGEKNDRE